MRRGYANTPLGQIHYREAGSGPPLVLVHQTPLSGDMFAEVLPLLAGHFRVLAPDTPGYGSSPGPARPPGMWWYVEALAGFLDAVGVERAALVGVHTGASIAVELAASQPHRVSHLILVGCPDYDPATRQEKIRSVEPAAFTADGGHLRAAWDQARTGHWASWATLEQIQRGVIDRLAAGRNVSFATLAVFQHEIRERIPFVTAPTLLLYGPGDPFAARQPHIAPLFPNAREQVIPGASPLPMQQLPGEFARVLTSFVQDERA